VQGGGIPGASENAGKRVPGLVFGVTAENLSAYTKGALHRFVEVFPEVDAIQFRMHDESGLKHEASAAVPQTRNQRSRKVSCCHLSSGALETQDRPSSSARSAHYTA
jgi:hypothetical protein